MAKYNLGGSSLEGLIASLPVSPIIVLGVLAGAIALGVFAYPYVNDRWQFLRTYGVWPPAEGSVAHRMVQRRVSRTLGKQAQDISAKEAQIAGIEEFWDSTSDQPDELADMVTVGQIDEEKSRLDKRRRAARRLARKFKFQEDLVVPTQPQNGKSQHPILEQTKAPVTATSKGP